MERAELVTKSIVSDEGKTSKRIYTAGRHSLSTEGSFS